MPLPRTPPASLATAAECIDGTLSREHKISILESVEVHSFYGGFAWGTVRRLRVTEATVRETPDEPERKEGRVVCEVEADHDMLNALDTVHGACAGLLIDFCTGLAIKAYRMHTVNDTNTGVSLSLDTVFHSPALLGDKLRIISMSMTAGKRAMSARSEIWNETRHRLVASGVHVKMVSSTIREAKM